MKYKLHKQEIDLLGPNVYPYAGHRASKYLGEVFMFRPGHSLAHLRWESEPEGEFGLSLPNNRANIALL